MKKQFIILFVFITAFTKITFSQTKVSPNHYCIYFTDKEGTPYSIDKPEEFLSQKSIDRRKKFDIKITEQDLPVNPKYIEQVKELGFKMVNLSKWMNCAIIYCEDETSLSKLENLTFVNFEAPAKISKSETKTPKTYTAFEVSKKDLKIKNNYKYGKGSNQIKMLNGEYLHNTGFRGEGMTMAILDNGFYHVNTLPAFDSIMKNKQILGYYDFVENDTEVFDKGTHGMSVLSTIGANMPGEFIGTAPKAQFWLIRTENNKSEYLIEEYSWICGAEFADSAGVDMIHSSLGYSDFDDETQNHTYEEMDGNSTVITIASDIAASKGILLTTSAGNSGSSAWKYITAPADADSCLTVGACWRRGKPAGFSSKGYTKDNRIKPNVTAKGVFTTVQKTDGKLGKSFGTSVSGPIIAGLAACLWQAFPEFSNMEIIEAIEISANQCDSPDEEVGYGIPDFGKAYLYLKNKADTK